MSEAPPTDVLLGIQLAKFQDVLEALSVDPSMHCFQLKDKLRDFTSESELSFCEHVKDFDKDNPLGAHVSMPTVLISYSMSYRVGEVLESLKEQCSPTDSVWWDLFSTPMRGTFKPYLWWRNTFFGNVKAIGRVVLVMTAGDVPIMLTRTWPMFELWAAIRSRSTIDITFIGGGLEQFLTLMRIEWRGFHQSISELKLEGTETADPHDKMRIGEVVSERGGYEDVDEVLRGRLKMWFGLLIKEHCDKTEDEVAKMTYTHILGALSVAQREYPSGGQLLQKALKGRKRLLGEEHHDTLITMQSLGQLCYLQHMNTECEGFWGPYVQQRDKLPTDNSFVQADLVETLESFASLYEEQQRWGDAEATWTACVEAMERVCGNQDRKTLRTKNNLALMLDNAGKRAEAEQAYVQCYNNFKTAFGEKDEDALMALYNLGRCYYNQSKLEEAEMAYKECLAGYREVLGEDHSDTIRTMNNLATMYDNQKRYKDAEPIYLDCWLQRKKVLGDNHPDTLKTCSSLAGMWVQLAKYDHAISTLEDCLHRQKAALPEGDEAIKQTESWLEKARSDKQAKEEAGLEEQRAKAALARAPSGDGGGPCQCAIV